MAEVSVAADVRLALGESPVWVARTRTLHFVDIPAGALYSLRPGGALSGPFKVGAVVGAVVPRAAGGLLACLDHTVVPVGEDGAPAGGPLCSVAPVEGMRFNDAKCDPQGRLWAGTMHANWRNPASPPGALYTLRPAAAAPAPAARSPAAVQLAGAAVVAAAVAGAALATRASSSSGAGRTAGRAALAAGAGAALPGAALASAPPPPTRVATAHQPPSLGVSVPGARLSNGMTWSPDGATLFWVDSGLNRIEAFDFDGASGAVSNRRTAVTVPPLGAGVHGAAGGIPDGCTIDAAGKLWVALAESGTVVQYDPETGAQAAAVALPARRVTACTFGGEGLGELFVTMRQEAGAGGCREAGAVFRVRVPGVRGLHAAYEYAG